MRAGRFACHQCQKISYTSQSGSDTSRGYASYHRLHALIAAGKPKWQRWATFQRLEDRFARVDERAHLSLLTVDQYEVFCAVLYLLRTGCQWRFLPSDFPKWRTVHSYFAKWSEPDQDGISVLERALKKSGWRGEFKTGAQRLHDALDC